MPGVDGAPRTRVGVACGEERNDHRQHVEVDDLHVAARETWEGDHGHQPLSLGTASMHSIVNEYIGPMPIPVCGHDGLVALEAQLARLCE